MRVVAMPYEVRVQQPHVVGDPCERDTLKAQVARHAGRFTAPSTMSDVSIWGKRVRLQGGHLAHWAGGDQDGATLLAHGDFAWTDRLMPASDDTPECTRCARRLPALEHMVRRATEDGVIPPSAAPQRP
jgi:hypothetical protein